MKKPLVLYFSVYGTAKSTAEEIARQTGADLAEIEPAVPYDGDRNRYNALARLAKREHDEDRRPAIKNKLPIADYDTVFIGYPMWWYTFPMIIYTLFESYDFAGKTVIPFNTHMGSGDGGTYETVKQLCPKAKVLPGLPVEMSDAERGVPEKISRWLAAIHTYLEVKTPLTTINVKYGKDVKTLPPKPFSSTDRMVKHLKELAGSLKDHEKAVFLQVFQYRITEKKARLRSTHYEEVSQTFKDASQAGVEFWEVQMDFRPEGVTLYSVTRSTDL